MVEIYKTNSPKKWAKQAQHNNIMKQTSKIVLTLLTLLSIRVLNGQVIQSIGIKSGLCISNQEWHIKSLNKTLETENRTGFYSAVTLDFFKSKYFNFTTDIGYIQKGSQKKIPYTTVSMPEGDGTYVTNQTQFNYFILSPIFKIKYETKHIIPYAILGGKLDYQLSYQSDMNLQYNDRNLNKAIWGLTSGAGVAYRIKSMGINAEFQHYYDFTKLIDTPSTPTNAGLSILNRAYIINLGIQYYLHKRTP